MPLLLALSMAGIASAQDLSFKRGDSNVDGRLDLSDSVRVLVHLFVGGEGSDLPCKDAADSNDSGTLDMSDPVYLLNFLFNGGPEPKPPFGACGKDTTADALTCDSFAACDQTPPPLDSLKEIGHVLNRIAYGASPADVDRIQQIGLTAYIDEQLDPDSIDESANTALNTRVAALFTNKVYSRDTRIIRAGDIWRYRKGTSAVPVGWHGAAFDDSGPDWLQGPTGIGYGDGDDRTVLADMRQIADDPETTEVNEAQPGYATVAMRKIFNVADPAAINDLVLKVDYDDGFIAYLNGGEVARANVNNVAFNAVASAGHDAGTPVELNISQHKGRLVAGQNVLAIQVHNSSLGSSDLSMIPELLNREVIPGPAKQVIRGIDELQQLHHVRGVYSRKQLQAVMADFWDNHFTTDQEKLRDYFDALQNSDANDAMGGAQAASESSQAEYEESEFFYDNALGQFGDLLLYSATSPAMLVYLDNVLNFKASANENYAREILELFAFGVDNRYVQRDIEQLAKCFTGWFVCKVDPLERPAYPDASRMPPAECGVQFQDTQLVGLGAGWKYFKGRQEPSPAGDGTPTTAWATPEFDDSAWLNGSTGIGYGDGDDATVLSDMQNGYRSVYLRRRFTVADPEALHNLLLAIRYDDGFTAYVNGIEVARSESMEDTGTPPAFDEYAENTEVAQAEEVYNLAGAMGALRPAPETNVLAIQVHNADLASSDLSCLPRLVDREILPGSVENGDPNAEWTFFFDASQHDTTAKVLFDNTQYEINVPAGRTGAAGLRDALDVVDAMANHPSTREFICIKLIQKFVYDVDFGTYLNPATRPTIPVEIRSLLADMDAEWRRTSGNIGAVMRVLLDPETRQSAFWSELAYRSKVKTPLEFVNSTLRALDATASGRTLPAVMNEMGMPLQIRDEPDGYSELGGEWASTQLFLEHDKFGYALAGNTQQNYTWNPQTYLGSRGLDTADEIVDHFIDLLFQGYIADSNRQLFLDFLNTDDNGNPLPFNSTRSDFRTRVQELVRLMLATPMWKFQ